MYKRASNFFQRHVGLLVTIGKTTKKRRKKHKANTSSANIGRLKFRLTELFPERHFSAFCKYDFGSIKTFLYKSRKGAAEQCDIVVVVNPGPIRTLTRKHKRIFWNPPGTDKLSIARFTIEKGLTYKAVKSFLLPESASRRPSEKA